MFWMVLSLLFCVLIYRELTSHLPISKPYLAILIVLALLTAWPPFHLWQFERQLNTIARKLSGNTKTHLHCNTLFDTLFDEDPGVTGHADFETFYLVIQYPRCHQLMDYLNHPDRANIDELVSLNTLTHEIMHARGEKNEAITECEAVQRNHQTAMMLGVPEFIAKENAVDYFQVVYKKRKEGRYFSKECRPTGALDEHLSDSVWESTIE